MTKKIQKIYHDIAPLYEKVNHILTLGLDIRWRNRTVREIIKIAEPGWWLDICSGTGELAGLLGERRDERTRIISADFSEDMIHFSRERNKNKNIRFCLCNAQKLPFADETFEAVTISFATRNIDSNRLRLLSHFHEFNRVLKQGGVFFNLETSQPNNPFIRSLFHLYIRLTVLPVGRLVSGSHAAYAYLSSTIPKFYNAPSLSSLLKESGFSQVEYQSLFLGAAAIHKAVK